MAVAGVYEMLHFHSTTANFDAKSQDVGIIVSLALRTPRLSLLVFMAPSAFCLGKSHRLFKLFLEKLNFSALLLLPWR